MTKFHELLEVIPKEEIDRVLYQDNCELDYEFLGFTEVYKQLAKIIPLNFTIVDLGCYCSAQSYYFLKHKRYIGVDSFVGERFITPNSVHYVKKIQHFICEDVHIPDNENNYFAICVYVPDSEARKMTQNTFENLFVLYP